MPRWTRRWPFTSWSTWLHPEPDNWHESWRDQLVTELEEAAARSARAG